MLVFFVSLWVFGVGLDNSVYGRSSAGAENLPSNLFSAPVPSAAMSVGYARQNAQEGQTIILYGTIGGAAKPIAQNRAIFLMTDTRLPPCTCGCPTPWDSCCAPRQQVMANMATIQIADGAGRPLKASLLGVNGLQPAAELMVTGTVLKRTPTLLILNAQNIHMNARPSKMY